MVKRYDTDTTGNSRESDDGEYVKHDDIKLLLAGLLAWSEESSTTCGRAANGYDHDAPLAANLRSRQRAYQECGVKIQAAISRMGKGE